MSRVLSIETATRSCSVALSLDRDILFSDTCHEAQSHAVQLGVMVDKALAFARREGISLDAVAVSGGPGSYTGLRIGTSMAKGLCYGLGIPLVAVPTLQIMAGRVARRENPSPDVLLCPMIDARRMEVYTALYTPDLEAMSEIQALVVEPGSFEHIDKNRPLWIFGDGAAKTEAVIAHRPLRLIEGIFPCAEDMIPAAIEALQSGRTEDVAYYEPFYLKEFQATVPTKLQHVIHSQH